MSASCLRLVASATLVLAWQGSAFAQGSAGASSSGAEGWQFSVYPILAWVPTHIGIDVDVPPIDGGVGQGAEILDSSFDGAFFAGLSASNGTWRVDADVLWAAVGGDRPERPRLTVDLDIIYGHATGGRRIYKDLFVTAGVRRFALDYDLTLDDQFMFSRKPGLWDPLIGIGWHRIGQKLEFHGILEGGGFGVGADSDVGASFRVDWKPVRHFGLTAGYTLLTFRFDHELAGKTFEARQTFHGPVLGVGFYF